MCRLNKIRTYKNRWTVYQSEPVFKVKDLEYGMIVWQGNNVLGVKGVDLPKKYYNKLCKKVDGNRWDYELINENI